MPNNKRNSLTRHLSPSGPAWHYNLYSNFIVLFMSWWDFRLHVIIWSILRWLKKEKKDINNKWWPDRLDLMPEIGSEHNLQPFFVRRRKKETTKQFRVDPTIAMEVEVSQDPSWGRIIQPCWVDKHLNYENKRWNADTMHKPTWTQLCIENPWDKTDVMHWCNNMMWRWCWLKPECIDPGNVYSNQVVLFTFWRLRLLDQPRQNTRSMWSFMLLSFSMYSYF